MPVVSAKPSGYLGGSLAVGPGSLSSRGDVGDPRPRTTKALGGLIGWHEILDGGVAPNATVMSWRGTEGGIEAARQGHDVVMTPYSHLYLDFYQTADQESEPLAIGGFLPLDTVYAYEPVPAELTPTEAKHVLGAQANVWTEYMTTEDHVEYMVFPRMLALSEVVWSPREIRDYSGFVERLDWHFDRLEALGVNYRPLDR